MKKIVSLLLVSLLIISGCNIKGTQEDDVQIKESNIDLRGRYLLTSDMSRNKRIDHIYVSSKLDDMYPFNEITYSDKPEFKRNGSNGQVMVEIPKHYFKRYLDNDHEYIEISEEMKEGYELDPAFVEDDKLNIWSSWLPFRKHFT